MTSTTNAKAEEERRVAAAKRQIEADRDAVRQRVERERIVREAREAARRQSESEPHPQEEPQFHVRGQGQRLDAPERTGAESGGPQSRSPHQGVGPEDDADMAPGHEEEDDGEETDEEERAFRRQDIQNRMGMFGMASNAHHWGGGQKLGD